MIWFLHGNLGEPSDWAKVQAALGSDDVRALNLWDYQSFLGRKMDEVARLINEEIRQVDESPVLCGYSMGGRLALHMLSAAPNLFRAVLLLSTNIGLKAENERQNRLLLDEEWAKKCETNWELFWEEWNAQPVLASGGEGNSQNLKKYQSQIAQSFRMWSLGFQPDFSELLEKTKIPIFGLAGQKDKKFSQIAKRCSLLCYPKNEELRNERWRIIPNVGHRLPMLAPEAVAEQIKLMIRSY